MSPHMVRTISVKARSLFIGLLVFAAAFTLYGSSVLTVSAQGGVVVLEETFSDNSNGWKADGALNCKAQVSDGHLSLTLDLKGSICFATPKTKIPDDSTVEVSASSSSAAWDEGIIVRADARDTSSAFYHFLVDNAGHWDFARRTDDGKIYEDVRFGQVKTPKAGSPVALKVDVKGNTFTFTINGQKVGTFSDTTLKHDQFTQNYFGLIVETGDKVDSTTSEFSDLKVSAPALPPTPTLGSDALLKDTFQDNKNNWHVLGSSACKVDVKDSALTITISKQADACKAVPTAYKNAVSDQGFTIAVDGYNTGNNWNYGVIMRSHNPNLTDGSAYLFLLTSAGQWYFMSINAGKQTELQSGGLPDAMMAKVMHMQVTVQGSHFSFKVNDANIGPFDDTSIKPSNGQTYFGLFAVTYLPPDSPVITTFTNLVVSGSKPGAPVKPAPTKVGQVGPTAQPRATTALQGGDQGGYGTVTVLNRIAVQLTVTFAGPVTQTIRVPALSNGSV